MGKKEKILFILFFLLVAIILFSGNGTKKINWTPTYMRNHKIPFGTYVLYHELQNLFPGTEIKPVNRPPFVFLTQKPGRGAYILVNNFIFPGKEEWGKLLNFISEGNDVLLASKDFDLDTFGFKTKYFYPGNSKKPPVVSLVNPVFKKRRYELKKSFMPRIFEKVDTQNTTVLGTIAYLSESGTVIKEGVNFIKYNYGKGHLYLHATPSVFTNYFILDSLNHNYTSGVLTYLGKPPAIYWDAYYKSGRVKVKSPLYYIFNTRSLKWAYYILLATILLFIIFEGRRKQRSIKVLEPVKNKTLQFTRTIANMYFENGDHKKIAQMKMDFFFDYIRSRFSLDTQNTDKAFIHALALKSGQDPAEVKKMLDFFARLKSKSRVTKEELSDLESIIENFKKKN